MGQINPKVRAHLVGLWRVSVLAVFALFLVTGQINLTDILIIIAVHWVWYMIGLEIGYHKLLAHTAFKTSPTIKYTLAFIGNLLCHPSVLAWVGIHRKHHAYSDKPQDPHSPHYPKQGLLKYLFTTDMYVDNLPAYEFEKDKTLLWIDQHQPHLIYGMTILLLFFLDPKTILIWFAMPSAISPYCLGIANYVTHQGKHNGYDYARNWYWIEILAPGMGFHGNHHDTPGSWSLAKKYWWADVSSVIVKLIKR